jgi:magnesium chelatase family protein
MVVARRVAAAIQIQHARYKTYSFSRNAHIPPGLIDRFCFLDQNNRAVLQDAAQQFNLSSRAFHSILKVARTIADLEGSDRICKDHLMEAVQHRRYCEGDVYWNYE